MAVPVAVLQSRVRLLRWGEDFLIEIEVPKEIIMALFLPPRPPLDLTSVVVGMTVIRIECPNALDQVLHSNKVLLGQRWQLAFRRALKFKSQIVGQVRQVRSDAIITCSTNRIAQPNSCR
jgi:hypothetical protein